MRVSGCCEVRRDRHGGQGLFLTTGAASKAVLSVPKSSGILVPTNPVSQAELVLSGLREGSGAMHGWAGPLAASCPSPGAYALMHPGRDAMVALALSGTPVGFQVASTVSSLSGSAEAIWAHCLVLSRLFALDILEDGYSPPLRPVADQDSGVLIPGLDYANHSPEACAGVVAHGDSVSLVLKDSVTPEEGMEVSISYGAYGNETLLRTYGFVIEKNPCPVAIDVVLGGQVERLTRANLDEVVDRAAAALVFEAGPGAVEAVRTTGFLKSEGGRPMPPHFLMAAMRSLLALVMAAQADIDATEPEVSQKIRGAPPAPGSLAASCMVYRDEIAELLRCSREALLSRMVDLAGRPGPFGLVGIEPFLPPALSAPASAGPAPRLSLPVITLQDLQSRNPGMAKRLEEAGISVPVAVALLVKHEMSSESHGSTRAPPAASSFYTFLSAAAAPPDSALLWGDEERAGLLGPQLAQRASSVLGQLSEELTRVGEALDAEFLRLWALLEPRNTSRGVLPLVDLPALNPMAQSVCAWEDDRWTLTLLPGGGGRYEVASVDPGVPFLSNEDMLLLTGTALPCNPVDNLGIDLEMGEGQEDDEGGGVGKEEAGGALTLTLPGWLPSLDEDEPGAWARTPLPACLLLQLSRDNPDAPADDLNAAARDLASQMVLARLPSEADPALATSPQRLQAAQIWINHQTSILSAHHHLLTKDTA